MAEIDLFLHPGPIRHPGESRDLVRLLSGTFA
ncbi:hypothetical protein GGR46_001388 [Sphingomonas kyeonggiensis]|uniref:Uncharacterized protein n=1 Tax=Sphingomonas kyeonggiensis TaxID=1268553 RepID=A0A7W6JQW2_9SPHN|nr:hypothetical protein [Sphingomonas kyeonggiensis]